MNINGIINYGGIGKFLKDTKVLKEHFEKQNAVVNVDVDVEGTLHADIEYHPEGIEFTLHPEGEAVLYLRKFENQEYETIEGIEILANYIEWDVIDKKYAGYYDMVLTNKNEWVFYPVYKECQENLKYYTKGNEEIENKLLGIA